MMTSQLRHMSYSNSTYLLFLSHSSSLFFFNNTTPTEIYTLSLHDALPISCRTFVHREELCGSRYRIHQPGRFLSRRRDPPDNRRSEEHTSELQSRSDLVCRLLLEKKKKIINED